MIHAVSNHAEFINLYRLNLIPLYTVVCALTWVIHDYFITLEDEVTYIWRQKPGLGKSMFFLIRYYTIFLVLLDAVQIHSFAIPGVVTLDLCLAADPTIRIAGAISLWSVQIIMQLRVYILFNRSRKVALFNGVLFFGSVGAFLSILTINAFRRRGMIAAFVGLPLKGCPAINGGLEWCLWVPAMLFEFNLFGFALYKSIVSIAARTKLNERPSLVSILVNENILYFFIIAFVLFINNLMVIKATKIPWFGLAPFHAAVGITVCRMLIHLRKFATENLENGPDAGSLPDIQFTGNPVLEEIRSHSHSTDRTESIHDIESDGGILTSPAQNLGTQAGPSRHVTTERDVP